MSRTYSPECEIWAVLLMCQKLIPRCAHCRVTVRVDNLPVVYMLQRLSCRSRACLPILREIAWLCACWDVVVECVHIGTKVNTFADCLSRIGTTEHDPRELLALIRGFKLESSAVDWQLSWPPGRAVRPDLAALLPVCDMADLSAAWAALPEDDLAYIFPRILRAGRRAEAACTRLFTSVCCLASWSAAVSNGITARTFSARLFSCAWNAARAAVRSFSVPTAFLVPAPCTMPCTHTQARDTRARHAGRRHRGTPGTGSRQ